MKPMKFAVFFILAIAITTACMAEPTRFKVEIEGKGSPMILIPGLNSPGSVWDDMVKHYSPSYETHTLTLAGFAGMPLQGEASLSAVKDELVTYINENKLKDVVIVGHSLGGFLALWTASETPNAIEALVIVDSLPFLPLVFNPAATEEGMKPIALQQTQGIAISDEAGRRQYYAQNVPGLLTNPDYIELIVDTGVASDPKMTAQSMYELYTTDLRDEIANIKAKTLVLGSWMTAKPFGGTIDTVRQQYEFQYQNLKNAEVVMHEDAKHFIMLDAPEWTIAQTDKLLK